VSIRLIRGYNAGLLEPRMGTDGSEAREGFESPGIPPLSCPLVCFVGGNFYWVLNHETYETHEKGMPCLRDESVRQSGLPGSGSIRVHPSNPWLQCRPSGTTDDTDGHGWIGGQGGFRVSRHPSAFVSFRVFRGQKLLLGVEPRNTRKDLRDAERGSPALITVAASGLPWVK